MKRQRGEELKRGKETKRGRDHPRTQKNCSQLTNEAWQSNEHRSNTMPCKEEEEDTQPTGD